MKITKTQLKQIIEEEIKELDEGVWDSIKYGAEDAWDAAKGAAGAVTGIPLSYKQKKKDKAKKKKAWDKKMDDEDAAAQADIDARKARSAEVTRNQKAKWDREERAKRQKKRDANRVTYGAPEKEIETQFHDDERYDSRWGAQAESINRDKLARIVAEELQKVLKDR